jgi:hypothetical protein
MALYRRNKRLSYFLKFNKTLIVENVAVTRPILYHPTETINSKTCSVIKHKQFEKTYLWYTQYYVHLFNAYLFMVEESKQKTGDLGWKNMCMERKLFVTCLEKVKVLARLLRHFNYAL